MLPPIPNWEGLHPLVVHFPIGLLLVAPLPVLIGLVVPKWRMGTGIAALGLMVLGTAAAFLSVATGEAAGELAERSPAINDVLERHEERAEAAQWIFAGLTLSFGALTIVPTMLKKNPSHAVIASVHVLFLAVYLGGAAWLADTAHQGGRLVHEFGVHSLLPDSPAGPDAVANGGRRVDEDDE